MPSRPRDPPLAPGRPRSPAAPRLARQILSLWQQLEMDFSPDRGKSEGCRQIETRAGRRRAAVRRPARGGAPGRVARQILSFWIHLEIHFAADRAKSEDCRQIEARSGLFGAPPSGRRARRRRAPCPGRPCWRVRRAGRSAGGHASRPDRPRATPASARRSRPIRRGVGSSASAINSSLHPPSARSTIRCQRTSRSIALTRTAGGAGAARSGMAGLLPWGPMMGA